MASAAEPPAGNIALVTGLSGFTGRYVAAGLEAAGYRVTGLGRDENGQRIALEHRQQVLRAVADIAPDVVIHLAAIAHVAHDDAEQIYHTNLIGTRHLLEALATAGNTPRKVILASSANIYGHLESGILDENAPLRPANDYAVSKLSMEYMARLWLDRLPIVFTRPFNYTGAGQDISFLIAKIVHHYATRAPHIELGNLEVWRDFSDVRDIARAYVALVDRGVAGEAYNLCSGMAWSLKEVLAAMEQIAGFALPVHVNPALVRSNEVRRLIGSPARLEHCIGPQTRIPFADTLRWMYDSARAAPPAG